MSVISRLFTSWNGGQSVVKNGKFSTTKNNHNRDKHNRPTVYYAYNFRILRLWLGNKFKDWCKGDVILHKHKSNMPSYMNPKYRQAYHQPKRAYK